ncbi:ImmA/IrrE family metallo-endopeptidase [Kocuria sp. M1R5S2]|uniref:ImmA/IrrE family metallo-endopeptidase n=1 Tax=Kocuria rhizosphaerae TaxID=3376285 RepID=UPI0037B9B1BC
MAVFRVPVAPAVLRWAAERSGRPPEDLEHRFPELEAWERGDRQPTFHQLEQFAQATFTPFGSFFLAEPPVDKVPIPDFRTVGNHQVDHPSPDLLETIFICEQRQEWYRQHALISGAEPLPFIGSATVDGPVVETADRIREVLQFTDRDRAQDANWSEALRRLIDSAEEAGILVMVSGIVGNNTHRVLDPGEFRGFALSDPLAPLVFVNGADTKAAQIFTLIHEVCHLWLGQSALTDATMRRADGNAIELWCNQVAAEVLVPLAALRSDYRGAVSTEELDRLARMYKVSTLVVLKRIFDADLLDWDAYRAAYDEELSRVMALLAQQRKTPGGNYYNTQPLRVSRRFARALINDTKSGRTLHRDAFRLLGTRKHETFVRLGEQVGVA